MVSDERYISNSELDGWLKKFSGLDLWTAADPELLSSLSQAEQTVLNTLRSIRGSERVLISKRNDEFAQREYERNHEFFATIEKNPLTDQQREAVVHDEDNSLVIAGAGSGKTSTIIAKVGYLLKRGLATPDQILLLAFTKKAADEMRDRLKKHFPTPIEVRTFHALGKEIIKRSTGKETSLSKSASDDSEKLVVIATIVKQLSVDPAYLTKLGQFIGSLDKEYRPIWDFKTERDYKNYLQEVEPRTLTGCLTQSYDECEIANWLTLHGIRYEYEASYEVDLATEEHRQYKPDFYLPDHKVYIEHWGITRSGRAAPFIDNDHYQEGMKWKRITHLEQGTDLVETCSWQRISGDLFTNLEEQLRARGVPLGQETMEAALQGLREKGLISQFEKLVSTFLSHFKSGIHSLSDLQSKARTTNTPDRLLLFLDLFTGIFEAYQNRLSKAGEIDFDDMIGGACHHVASGRYTSSFRYIIIDEFQDISHGRARLIMALRGQVLGCKLFCVGDDWQSIYRFAGSDVSLMTQFESHFGFTKITPLTKTFRFNDQIAFFSSNFVLKNPAQTKKDLTTQTTSSQAEVLMHRVKKNETIIPDILEKIARSGPASVFILNRYGKHSDPEVVDSYRRRFPLLKIDALTVHKSKGLEADYVIIDNLCGGRTGFPCSISDDSVLTLVLSAPDQCDHGEERRLFYVALTRTRRQVHLVGHIDNESPFFSEILKDAEVEQEGEQGSTLIELGTLTCPRCHRGQIKRRETPTGVFFGCTKYPLCDYRDKACPECRQGYMHRKGDGTAGCDRCGHVARVCPGCGNGILVKRNGGSFRGPFYGCSTFGWADGACRYTEAISVEQ